MRSRSVPRARSACSRPQAASPGLPPGCCSPGACGARQPDPANGVTCMLNRTVSAALLGVCALALLLAAGREAPAAAGPAQIGSFGLDLSGGDPSVKPGDDFARYANGRWLDTAQIPPD